MKNELFVKMVLGKRIIGKTVSQPDKQFRLANEIHKILIAK